MKIAMARVPESATPRLALACDGALYDVAELQAGHGSSATLPTDYHARVIGLACAGLSDQVERLRSGLRPSRARLGPSDLLLLPPCDVDRAHAFQLGPQDVSPAHPWFRMLDARRLLGDAETVPVSEDVERVEVEASIAVVLREELCNATARDALGAVLGYTLMLEWGVWPTSRPWLDRRPWEQAGVQLGPMLVTSDEVGPLDRLAARITFGEESWPVGPFAPTLAQVGESLSFVSRTVGLRGGDVVGLGRLPRASASELGVTLRPGVWLCLSATGLGALRGRVAVRASAAR